MKIYFSFFFCCSLIVIGNSSLFAGSLNPPGSLAVSATGYTLNDIYVRIASGTAATGYYALFPVASPGATGVTLTQIYNALPGGTTTNAATTGDVLNGKTFITRANGVLLFSTGTVSAGSSHELSATGQVVSTATYDDAYNESHSVGFSSAARTMSLTMYNYTGGSLVQTTDINQSSVTVDNRTGLVWATNGNMTAGAAWATQLTWCHNLNSGQGYAGYTDWRMPSVREIMSVLQYDSSSYIDTTKFRNIQSYYWTSTTYVTTTTSAWYLYLTGEPNFDIRDKASFNFSILPVRGGP